ncbi:hypothetical protein Tco_1039448, partial [Tanacetum coccineum]
MGIVGKNIKNFEKREDSRQLFDETPMIKDIKQEGLVQGYYAAFISYHDAFICSTRNLGLNEEFVIDLFIFGLQPEIEERVRRFKPRSLSDAYALAKMDEVNGEQFVSARLTRTQVGVHCLEDSVMDVDQVCEEAGKCSELELTVPCKVDVEARVNCEEDGKGHESESIGVVDNNIDLHNHGEEVIENKEVRVLV